jgi:RimJ/RimL family protein N-acetyltransferase
MMEVNLRKLNTRDFPHFYKWWNDKAIRPLTSDNFEKIDESEIDNILSNHLKSADYHDFIIEAKPIGHALIQKKNDNYELYVAIGEKDYWDQGIGTIAVAKICDWFFGKFPGEDSIILEVNQDNPRAIRCYEKVGFEITGSKEFPHNKDTYTMSIHKSAILKK